MSVSELPRLTPVSAQPDRVDVGADEVLVGEVELRRRDLAGDHPLGPAEEVLVVRLFQLEQKVKTSAGWPLRPARPERCA